jgi:hypothetical protein
MAFGETGKNPAKVGAPVKKVRLGRETLQMDGLNNFILREFRYSLLVKFFDLFMCDTPVPEWQRTNCAADLYLPSTSVPLPDW